MDTLREWLHAIRVDAIVVCGKGEEWLPDCLLMALSDEDLDREVWETGTGPNDSVHFFGRDGNVRSQWSYRIKAD